MTDEWDDDDWYEVPPSLVGSATPSGSVMDDGGDDPLDLRWQALYVPDLTAQTGWGVHRVRDRSPERPARVRRIGYRPMRRRR